MRWDYIKQRRFPAEIVFLCVVFYILILNVCSCSKLDIHLSNFKMFKILCKAQWKHFLRFQKPFIPSSTSLLCYVYALSSFQTKELSRRNIFKSFSCVASTETTLCKLTIQDLHWGMPWGLRIVYVNFTKCDINSDIIIMTNGKWLCFQ